MHGKNTRRIVIFLMMIGLSVGAIDSLSAQVLLQYRYQPGTSLHYELKQELTTESDFGGHSTSSQVLQQLNLSTAINSVQPDGTSYITRSIDRIRMAAIQPGASETMEFDSNVGTPPEGPLGKVANALNQLVDQNIRMALKPSGEVAQVDIPAALSEAYAPPGANMAGTGSEEAIEKMLTQGSVVFPETPVKVNQSWTRELSSALPFGTMRSTVVFTYAGKTDDGLHRINAKTRISLEPQPDTPFQIKVSAAEGRGVYLFDAEQGVMLVSGLKQKMDLELTAAGQQMKQSITTDISMRLMDPNSIARRP